MKRCSRRSNASGHGIPSHDTFSRLFRLLDHQVNKANNEWFGLRYNYFGTDSYRFNHYRLGIDPYFYDVHTDDGLISQRSAQRKLSMMVQLSEPDSYEGGDFELHGGSASPAPEKLRLQGTVLVFPSLLRHRVTPLTRGERCTLVAWYDGPCWR